jgi:hypothetical protein
MVLADFLSYVHCQRSVDAAYRDRAGWTRRAILNVANMGRFSSDRTILGYVQDIWNVYVPPAAKDGSHALITAHPSSAAPAPVSGTTSFTPSAGTPIVGTPSAGTRIR